MKFEPENYIAKNDNTYVAPTRFARNVEKKPSTSEMEYVPPSKTIRNGKIEFTKPNYRYNPGAGYISNADPIAEFVIGNAVLGKPTQYLLDKGLKTVIGKTSGELLDRISSSAKTAKTNYSDIKNLKNFSARYQYEVPKLNPLKSNKIDDAYKTILNQHNTYARGICINKQVLKDRRISEPLIKAGIYNPNVPYSEQREKIAEYMATHIPSDTGYGRAGLYKNLEDGLYTSNSLDTAKGYTYGDGYVAVVKRPVDYSSSNRKNWLESGDFKIQTESPFIERVKAFKQKELDNFNDVSSKQVDRDNELYENIIKRYPNKYNREIANTIRKKMDNSTSNAEWSDYRAQLSPYFNELQGLRIRIGEKSIKKVDINRRKYFSNIEDFIKNDPRNDSKIIKFGMEETPLVREKISIIPSMKKLVSTGENPYQHFIFTGQPGEKVVDLVKLEPFSSRVNDYTRAHTGLWSEGLSRKSYKNGGLIKLQIGGRFPPLSDYDMLSKMNYEAAKGNPSAQRMVSTNPKIYKFNGNEIGFRNEKLNIPKGTLGTHFMSSFDNYAVPLIQDVKGKLQFNGKPKPSKEDIGFRNQEEASYFAENYKNVAPMMKSKLFNK